MAVLRVCAQGVCSGLGLAHGTALCPFQSPYPVLFAWVKLTHVLLVKFSFTLTP